MPQGTWQRAYDLGFALLGYQVFSGCFLVGAGAIRADDCGPVVFRQERVGLGRRMFRILKFRTMKAVVGKGRTRAWLQRQRRAQRRVRVALRGARRVLP
ncbi:MAG: sugar transferase [Myxococcota bacterium]